MPQPTDRELTSRAIIYDGFWTGSTRVKIRVPSAPAGCTVRLFDEDTFEELGSQVDAVSDDFVINVEPLTSARLIAFVNDWGNGTAGGVEVLPPPLEQTGWQVSSDEWLPMRYDPILRNSLPRVYVRQALEMAQKPLSFDVEIRYAFAADGTRQCTVTVTKVYHAIGSYTVRMTGPAGHSQTGHAATFSQDGEVTIEITEAPVNGSAARTAERTITIAPEQMILPPSTGSSAIRMYWYWSYLTPDEGYLLVANCRCREPVQFSCNGGVSWQDAGSSGLDEWHWIFKNVPPGAYTLSMRVRSQPEDMLSILVRVPYQGV